MALDDPRSRLTRRDLLKYGGAGGLALSLGGVLAACGGSEGSDAGGEASATGTGASPTTTVADGSPKRGGTLRVALIGGNGSNELLDPNQPTANGISLGRTQNVYSKLTDVEPDGRYTMQLAESMEANSDATEWTIRLKSGVVWHDGSDFTADDVVYSLQRQLDPKSELSTAASNISMIDPKGIEKVDDLTVRVKLLIPWSDLPAQVGQRYNAIVKAGTTSFTAENSNGTGPFKLQEWKPGERSVLVRNENYFEEGKPYVDDVEIVGIAEPIARLNALQAGQIDAAEHLDASQISVLESAGLKPIVSPPGTWTPIYMNTQVKPFDDVRVRQAMKYLTDREKMVEVAQQGIGSIANDLFGSGDPLYASEIEQREYDPERAVALLKEAGYADYEFTLHTSEATPPMMPSALILAESAKAAGIKLKTQKHPVDTFWSEVYGKVSFNFSSWGWRPWLSQWVQAFDTFNKDETNWKNDRANDLAKQVAATVDEARRKELAVEVQQIVWDEGGYVIWGFGSNISGVAGNVNGIEGHIFNPLGWYGFKNAWFA